MLSKEEIEKWSNEEKVEALAKFVVLRSGNLERALLYGFMLDSLLDEIDKKQKYIEQLESDKQKLIEKLEEDIEEYRKSMDKTDIKLNKIHYMKRIEYAKEILEILKGENDE